MNFMKKIKSAGRSSGFALIATISLMVLLVMIALAMLSLSSIELRSSRYDDAMNTARANARMALMIAIGELQKSAGPDQRVTAAADILADDVGNAPAVGREHWLGVWDSANYNPINHSTKNDRFQRWLVSSNTDLTAVSDANSITISDPHTIFTGTDANNTQVSSKVIVDKIAISDSNSNFGSKYAYWVEDEGVKASAAWVESSATDTQRKQDAFLNSIAGPDLGVFYSSISPLDETSGHEFKENLGRVISVSSISLANNKTGDFQAWLKTHHHDLTVGSYGVFADMKLGGLKRDLSLAFEMDGDAGIGSLPDDTTLFNKQVDEFVGNAAATDRLNADSQLPGSSGLYERFLYRDKQGSGSYFSGEIAQPYAYTVGSYNRGFTTGYSIRGPNWWALRDYANMYKRLKSSGSGYSMQPRAYTGYDSDTIGIEPFDLDTRNRTERSGTLPLLCWNFELNKESNPNIKYVFRPTSMPYACYSIATIYNWGVKDQNGFLRLYLDPIFYVWNPYNVTLESQSYTALFEKFGGSIQVDVVMNDDTVTSYADRSIAEYVQQSGNTVNIAFKADNLTFEPGEVKVLSASQSASEATQFNNVLTEGFEGYGENSGFFMDKLPVSQSSWMSVDLSDVKEVRVEFKPHSGVGLNYMFRQAFSLTSATPRNSIQSKEFYTASYGGRDWVSNSQDHDYELDGAITFTKDELSGKSLFAGLAYMMNPANSEVLSVEQFTQFNPIAVGNSGANFNLLADPMYSVKAISKEGMDIDSLNVRYDIGFSPTYTGYWGSSYFDGQTHIIPAPLPVSPMHSLVQFNNATLTTQSYEPMKSVGNSFAHPMVSQDSVYETMDDSFFNSRANSVDHTWLLNDALFDRYFFSGIAPDYSHSPSYSTSETLTEPLEDFYGDDYLGANASSAIVPYFPMGKDAATIVAELDDETDGLGYKKLAAYSLLKDQFNVNSTSQAAWEALLRANRGLDVEQLNGGTDSGSDTPFPEGSGYVDTGEAYWSGVRRLDEDEISDLAEKIVEQVKARGPFLSLSDFINRRLSSDAYGNSGALQSAIDATSINSSVDSSAGGTNTNYGTFSDRYTKYIPEGAAFPTRKTTTGIAEDITQAKLLMALAPKLNARSDTFKIRAYGETLDLAGNVVASATCEAVVQRVPEYLDETDEPWKENYSNPLPYTDNAPSNTLTLLNQQFGRNFKIVSVRWLNESEI